MFWIMGAEEIVHSLYKVTGSHFWGTLSKQLQHPAWNGFTAYDCIFPLFLFMAGVATPYSVGRELEKGKPRSAVLLRVIRRGLILVILGIVANNGLVLRPMQELRFGSVLGHIGLGYMFANMIYLYSGRRAQMVWFGGIILFYWLLLKFTSAPGYPIGDLTMQGNFVSYVDRLFLPGKLYLGIHDPEGILSTIPAISTALLGILAGTVIRHDAVSGERKSLRFVLTGVAFIVIAQIWNLDFPINKNLWTSSFVMQVGGISLILLGIFYYVIDVRGYRSWAFFFRVIGMNSILIYLSGNFIDWEYSTNAFFAWLGQLAGNPWNAVVLAIAYVIVKWCFLYFMYRKKVFLKV